MPLSWLRLSRTLGLLLAVMGATLAHAAERQDLYVDKAVFANGQLWLLAGWDLSRIAENGTVRLEEKLPDRVLDLCAQGNQAVVVTGPARNAGLWTIHRRVGDRWQVEATVNSDGDRVAALDCRADRVLLLTTLRLIDVGARPQTVTALAGPLWNKDSPGHVSATFDSPGQLWVAFDAGEWGGALQRVDMATGTVVTIQEEGTHFGTFMDTVTALLPLPWDWKGRKGCLAVAVGLIHFVPSGRVMAVCGNTAHPLYESSFTYADGLPGDNRHAVPFYGLMAEGDTLVAAGIDGMYRITADGKARKSPLPDLKNIDGAWVSFALPHVVLVGSVQRLSVGPEVPMMVPR
ncbi:hypothetical protein [Nitrospirillum iridis]|uniref:WD40 repeat domain-containing protein n=1 Tax=Nitrospirillum iridis TaxID=765888 RepID=A0A7X0AUU3_9PROT|nr:hypothetical protein [Nitrospirillum iridis]MBB6250473.1 hypothetical protein [Nitrospirillum iridis]